MSYSIPEHWGRVSLGELTSDTRPICYGVLKPGPYVIGGVPLVRITDISENIFDDSHLHLISEELDKEFSRSKLIGGEILISIQGTIGRVAICPEQYEGANISRTIAVIEPDSRVDKQFLYWFLRYYGARDLFDAFGATRASLNISTLRELDVPLPPLKEQKRIAAILDKADALRQKRQQAIQLADEFLRSVFLDMFGDPVTNPKGWDELVLKDIANIRSGVTKGKKVDPELAVTLPYMRVANVQDGYLALDDIQYITVSERDAENCRLSKGDILLTEGGDPDKLGRGHVWNDEIKNCIHQNHIFSVRVLDNEFVRPEFLSSVISSSRGKRYFLKVGKQTTGIATINKTVLSEFEPFIPPVTLQDKYLTIVKKANSIKNSFNVNDNALFNSISQKAFAGGL